MPACGSPKLIAACHVLHRLLLPRHPPCALSSLTTKFTRHTGIANLETRVPSFANPTRRLNSMGLMPAHRAPTPISVARPSRLNSGTHKNLQRLVFCPIYSVVKYRPHQLALITPPERVWVLLIPECANSRFPPTQCSAPGDFH